MSKISDVLQQQEKNYIFPFLWLHHEDPKILKQNIQAIYDAGVRAFCIESRPHPDFVKQGWWDDLDLILSEAAKLNMKVWILDDSHFPTGYANGKIKSDFPQYQKLFLNIKQLDFRGPQIDATIILKYISAGRRFSETTTTDQPDKIIKVIAARKTAANAIDPNTLIDLTANLAAGLLHWNVPDGEWRVFTLVETCDGGEAETEGYLNPLVADATNVLVNEVYQPHLEHYQAEFGKTIAGFFSDEPRFGNQHGSFSKIGESEMVLPWRPQMLEEFFNEDYLQLPLLTTVTAGGTEKVIRLKYMNLVSQLYADNFTKVLADWCHQHHVAYIGHLIEDNGAHTRLGYGAGHYFRALDAQDMAGIDVVLNQIMPGMDNGSFKSMTKAGWDGEFFHYGLAKMGASLGHLDPKKHGRVMSEVFGAYGWSEGLPLMKYLTDHMLVRGVNHFVPHAFDPNSFPDPDCPPHFYANGHEPETRFYPQLFNYMNRMAHLLSDGQHIAHVAVLYHAEAEWLNGQSMPFEKPVKKLLQRQIDCEVVPTDYLLTATLAEKEFIINGEQFDTLIVPQATALPGNLLLRLKTLAAHGVHIYFINAYPQTDEYGKPVTTLVQDIGQVVALNEVTNVVTNKDQCVAITKYEPYLRFYHYQVDGNQVLMLVNEEPAKTINTTLQIELSGRVYRYDAMNNLLGALSSTTTPRQKVPLTLASGEATVLIIGQLADTVLNHTFSPQQRTKTLPIKRWRVAFATAETYPKYTKPQPLNKLINVNRLPGKETFSGNIKYSGEFELAQVGPSLSLDLGTVGEVAELYLNGQLAGRKINAPYQFIDVQQYLHVGKNKITIVAVNNLGINQQDFLSQYMLIKPAGLLGPITLSQIKEV